MSELIAKGAYGSVFTCDEKNEVKKLIDMEDIETDGVVFHIMREIATLKYLSNNSCTLQLLRYNIGRKYATLFFKKYKYTLYDYIYNSKLKKTMIPKVFYQILIALKQAQDVNIIHRDIKPQNIFMNSSNNVVVGDWGLARWFLSDREVPLSNPVETLNYRAPELLMESRIYDEKIETWSLGCLLYEMYMKEVLISRKHDHEFILEVFELCGKPQPSSSLSFLNNLPFFNKVQEQPKLLKLAKCLPADAYHLITKMLVFEPHKRYSLDDCLQHRFFDGVRCAEQIPQNSFKEKFALDATLLQHQSLFTNKERIMYLDWIYLLTVSNDNCLACFFVAAAYFDYYLFHKPNVSLKNLRLAALNCYVIAAKFLGYEPHNFEWRLNFFPSHKHIEINDIWTNELDILQTVDFHLYQSYGFYELEKLLAGEPDLLRKASCILFLSILDLKHIDSKVIYHFVKHREQTDTITSLMSQSFPPPIIYRLRHICGQRFKECVFDLNQFKNLQVLPEILTNILLNNSA